MKSHIPLDATTLICLTMIEISVNVIVIIW